MIEIFVDVWQFIHRKLNLKNDHPKCAWCCKPANFESPALLCDHHWTKWWRGEN